MFCVPGHVFGCTEGVGSSFRGWRSWTRFDGTEGVGSRFHVSRARTHFWRYRRRLSHFHVLRSRTNFRRFRGRHVPCSSFASRTHFGRYRGRRSHFHVLPAQTRFRRYRGHRVPFLCFALADSFSAMPRALGPVFMFSAPGLVFGVTEGVGFRFLVLRCRARFRRYRGRLVLFSCFALPYSFSAVPSASGPVFMFCAPVLIFGGTEGVRSRFHVLCARTCFPPN
jgi:hypothetical protein